MKTYHGERKSAGCVVIVTENDNDKHLNPRLDMADHSPTGFNWSYLGSGPAQLALAILADCTDDDLALQLYQAFKEQWVARLEGDWNITEREVLRIVEKLL